MTKKSIGTSPPRKDAIEKVTGQGIFVADLKLPGMLHIAVVRSTEPHAVIERIDTAEALNMPGVVTVVTGENCTLKVGHCIVDQPPMATGKVRYVGEPVAAVVAETKEQAVLAADKVQVSYLALPAVLKARDALKDGAPIIHEDLASYHSLPGFNKVPGTNVFHHYKLRKGDVAEGFEKADLIVENEFTFPHSCHGALEPHGAIALFDPEGKLTVWASSQSPFTVRNFLGAMFGIPLHQVRVIVPYLGGGFGCKSDTTIEPLVAWIARHAVGRPVRLILSREEVFCGSVIGRGFSTISRIGFDREGNITAAEVDIACSSGAYGENSINIVVGGGHNATGPNEIWSWDITYIKTSVRGQFYYVYLMMDIFSRKIVGFDIHESESMEYSSELVGDICKREGIERDQLTLHADNGGPMKGATMLAKLDKLGVAASFSRPRVSNDNPYSESLFKTLKYCPQYPDIFEDIEAAKAWMHAFVGWYNNHPHSGIKFVTPSERHVGADIIILENRKRVYEEAKKKNPLRWNGKSTRNWEREEKVYLNYLQKKKDVDIRKIS